MTTLAQKTIIIIGGTGGIGLATAESCLALGANVVAVGRDDAFLEKAKCALEKAVVFGGAAEDENTAQIAIDRANKTFGGFDGLVHVAGGSGRQQ